MRIGIRRIRGIPCITILALIIGLTINAISSTPFAQPQFLEEMVPMRDGVRLHTFVYLPDPKAWPSPYPAIVQRTSYGIGKAGVLPGLSQPPATLRGWYAGIGRGYAVVFQDTRGRFASEGIDRVFYNEAADGYDTVEWVATKSWCNGKVGVAGSSAAGLTTYAAASQNPPHLKAIFAQVGMANPWNDIYYEGGSFELERQLLWLAGNLPGTSSSHINSLKLSDKELQEVKDLIQAIDMDLKSQLLTSVESKWWMHLPLLKYPGYSQILPFWDETLSHPTQDDLRDHYNFRDKIQVPTLHVSTWYDVFLEDNIKTFKGLKEKRLNPKFFIGPGDHNAVYSPTFWPNDPFFPWFDYWLKGIDTKIMDGPPISYYHIGTAKWRYADQWPPVGVEYKNYFLHSDGILNTTAPSGEELSLSYLYDPKNPVQTLGGRNLSLSRGPRDQRPVEPPHRKDVLVYKSEILARDIEIAGPIKVTLHASSTCKDTDFHAKLIDVHPDGKTMLVLDGVIRALYRESPKEPVTLESGKVYEFAIVLGNINHVFKAGNRIQVDISSSNFPRRIRNTNSGNPSFAADTEKDIVVATNTVYHAFPNPSQLILPVLPPQKPNVFEGTATIEIPGVAHKGPAELYVFPKAVYMKFVDQWLKWKIVRIWRDGTDEHFESEGKTGTFTVVVPARETGIVDVSAKGQGVYFKGKVKW